MGSESMRSGIKHEGLMSSRLQRKRRMYSPKMKQFYTGTTSGFEDEKLAKEMNTETRKSYYRVCWIFLHQMSSNDIKIDPYNIIFSYTVSKLVRFLRPSVQHTSLSKSPFRPLCPTRKHCALWTSFDSAFSPMPGTIRHLRLIPVWLWHLLMWHKPTHIAGMLTRPDKL